MLRKFDKLRNSRKACAAIVAAGLLWGTGPASAAIDKAAVYQEMAGLARDIQTLKPQVRVNAQAATAFANAMARYRTLSASMGGDDPGRLGLNGGAAASAARRNQVTGRGSTPAGCNTSTATFTQSTPTPIADVGVVTSTVVVSGAGTYLLDADVTTFLTHTFAADVDMTITSPAGTVVTLTTDNGAGNDDVFNGTVWDDDANPAGQVPYVTNNGLVTDNAYVNLTTATPLVPEEAMGAFVGENPNGTWTITVSDDLAGDTGTLNSWSLAVTTLPNAPTVATVPTATQSTPTPIADVGVVTSTIVIAGAGTAILDVDVTTFLTHTFAADVDMTITSPAGTVVTLTTDNGAGNDDVFNGTVWDDDANPAGQVPYVTNNGIVSDHAYVNLTTATPLVPEEAMAAFIGEDPNGTWTITISDDLAGDTGTLNSWSLDIDTFTCASSDISITKTDGTPSASPGSSTTYTITVANAGPSAATGVAVVDNFPAACTSVTYTSTAAGGATGNTAGPTAGNINDAALNLPSGSSVTYTAVCSISGSAVGTLDNTATVTSAVDSTPGNNSATDSDTLVPAADISLTKTLTTVGAIQIGDNVTFALTVTNNGPGGATGVVVTDTLPAGLTYVSNSCGATFASPTLTWNVGALANGASATCNLTATATDSGMITNQATATSDAGDTVPANNTGTATVTVQGDDVITVPTVGEIGMFALMALLAASAAFTLRRRQA